MNNQKIVFIGGGNMGSCLISGLISDGYRPQAIHVVDPDPAICDRLRLQFQVQTHLDPREALIEAEILLLAVKPQIMKSVIDGIRDHLQQARPLIISVAAGIRSETLQDWLCTPSAIVRTMPNTPAMVGSAATALFATASVSSEQREMAESVMRSVGIIQWLEDESLMDAVTAVSGSGPAYFFRIMEAMEKAAGKLGLTADQARLLTIQTAFGAAKLALESSRDPAELRVQVTSPGGTTEQALAVLDDYDIDNLFEKALTAARNRSIELSEQFAKTSGES